MAKQTFSVGQVLTAAQMTSLQQTAMLGGSATAKTTSYTLVAADAGTVVSVNSTSATTITVNTGLFAAGDTVTIQNWGSGAVTITAGTATVNTAGSLIVPQYDGGVLYFTSASAAIYFDWVQAGATSPLTTKGDIWGYSTSDARIPVGANDTVLTADSTQALGVKWATPSSGGGMTLLETLSLSGTSVSSSTISGTYTNLYVIGRGISNGGASASTVQLRINGDTGTNYIYKNVVVTNSNTVITDNATDTRIAVMNCGSGTAYNSVNTFELDIPRYTQSVYKAINTRSMYASTTNEFMNGRAVWNNTAAITSFTFIINTGNFGSGSIEIYGVK